VRSLLLTVAATVALTCALAAVSPPTQAANIAGGNAFSELTGGSGAETATTATTAASTKGTTETSSTNSKGVILIVTAVAILLLCVIAFVIVRDARRMAPATEADLLEGRTAHDSSVRLRKRRAKAKAARRQRKRTR